jgi:hypothetical protein
MKTTLLILPLAVMTALLAGAVDRIVQPISAYVTTVRHQIIRQEEPVYYCSPLMNDRPFDYINFSLASRGTLTMAGGNPETAEVENVPFRIYLRRNGKIINTGASDTTCAVKTIDVSSVLSIAKLGDDLIIEPVRKSDASARRCIKLKNAYFYPNLFFLLKKQSKKGEGC